MTELLTVVAILSLLTIAVAVMVSASATTYKNSLLISESATVENMINTALSKELRYAEAVTTNGDESSVQAVKIENIPCAIKVNQDGYIVKAYENSYSALMNTGSYAGMHVENFSINYDMANNVFKCTYNLADKNSKYVSEPIEYSIKSAVFLPEGWHPGIEVMPTPQMEEPPAPAQGDYYYVTIVYRVNSNYSPKAERVKVTKNGALDVPAVLEGYTCNPQRIIIDKVTKNETKIVNCSPNSDTKYTVEFYLQHEGKYYSTPDESETRQGITDTVVALSRESVKRVKEGVQYILDDSQENILSGTIRGDGKLLLKVNLKQQFSITYENNGHGTKPATQMADYGTKINPAALSETGYEFLGWYLDSEFNQQLQANYEVKANITLYAKWNIKSYTVSFNLNGHGSPKPEDQIIVHGNKVQRPNNPAEDGYTFIGWYTEQGCTNAWDFNTAVTGSRVLYAKWLKNYTVKFVYDNGSADENVTVPDGYAVQSSQISAPNPSKRGYNFVSWNIDGGGQFAFGSTRITSNTTVRAKWNAKQYKVTFDAAGGDCGESIGEDNAYRNIYFDSSYSSGSYQYNVFITKNGMAASPSRSNYSFAGWYTSSGTQITGDSIFQEAENPTVYARWNVIVKISTSGASILGPYGKVDHSEIVLPPGTVVSVDGNTLKVNGSVVVTATANNNHSFSGWENHNSGTSFVVNGPMTVTARFSR